MAEEFGRDDVAGDPQPLLRHVLPADLPVPPAVLAQMTRVIAEATAADLSGEPDAAALPPVKTRSRSARESGRTSHPGRWLAVAAAGLLLVSGVGLVVGNLGGPRDDTASAPVGTTDTRADTGGAQAAADLTPTGLSAPSPDGGTGSDPEAATASGPLPAAAEASGPPVVTQDNVVSQVQRWLAEGARPDPIDPSCLTLTGVSQAPTLVRQVQWQGIPSMLVVFGNREQLNLWVVAVPCQDREAIQFQTTVSQ